MHMDQQDDDFWMIWWKNEKVELALLIIGWSPTQKTQQQNLLAQHELHSQQDQQLQPSHLHQLLLLLLFPLLWPTSDGHPWLVTPFMSQWTNGLCLHKEIKSTQGPWSWIRSGQTKKRQQVCINLGILNSLPCYCLMPPLHSSKPLFRLPSVFEPHLSSWLISLDKDILCIAHSIYLIVIW